MLAALNLLLLTLSTQNLFAEDLVCGQFDTQAPRVMFSEYDAINDSVELVFQDGQSGILGYRISYVNNGELIERTYSYSDSIESRDLMNTPTQIGQPPLADNLEKEKRIYLTSIRSTDKAFIKAQSIDGCGFISNDVTWTAPTDL